MKAELNKGKLSVNVIELLSLLSADEKKELIDSLSCEDDIIQNVADQIFEGYTKMGSYGLCGIDPSEPHTPLEIAIARVAQCAPEVCKRQMEKAINSLKSCKAWQDHYSKWAFAMYHGWGKTASPPHEPSPTIEDTMDYVVLSKAEYEKLTQANH